MPGEQLYIFIKWIQSCNHHPNQEIEHGQLQKFAIRPLTSHYPCQINTLSSAMISFGFELYINGIIQNVLFLSVLSNRFLYMVWGRDQDWALFIRRPSFPLLHYNVIFVINQVIVYVWVYFWTCFIYIVFLCQHFTAFISVTI